MHNRSDKQHTELGFSGSYQAEDVTFLLQKMDIAPTSVEEKEQLIQSGKKHYSQMISKEKAPSAQHLVHYQEAMTLCAHRMAHEVQLLGNHLKARFYNQPIVLVSLVRAGVPLGVLLKKYIAQTQACFHYGISIIRDRGIDYAALEYIIQKHGAASIVFVDGWTGKGAISRELTQSLQDYPELFEPNDSLPRLVALTDLGGCAWLAASADDWLIPSGILGSVVSGLISRSILIDDIEPNIAKQNAQHPSYWHGCIEYTDLQSHDISQQFITEIWQLILQNPTQDVATWLIDDRQNQNVRCNQTISYLSQHYQIDNLNRIKPSIAEATRAVLRRVPEFILLKHADDINTRLLRHFAEQNQVPVEILGDILGPYEAVTIIKKIAG